MEEKKTEPDYSHVLNMLDIEENARKLAVAWGDNMRDDFISQKIKLASDIMNYAKWYASSVDNKAIGWISVEEKLPEPLVKVLICLNYGNVKQEIKTSYMTDGESWNEFLYINITHWMPLPGFPQLGNITDIQSVKL